MSARWAGFGGARNHRRHRFMAKKKFQEELRPGRGVKIAGPFGTLLPRTAANTELRPNGNAVRTAAPASRAAGSSRFSPSRSASE